MGMTGFRQRDFWRLIVSVRDGTGSRYPLGASLSAEDNIFARLDGTVRNAFAKLQPLAVAV